MLVFNSSVVGCGTGCFGVAVDENILFKHVFGEQRLMIWRY